MSGGGITNFYDTGPFRGVNYDSPKTHVMAIDLGAHGDEVRITLDGQKLCFVKKLVVVVNAGARTMVEVHMITFGDEPLVVKGFMDAFPNMDAILFCGKDLQGYRAVIEPGYIPRDLANKLPADLVRELQNA